MKLGFLSRWLRSVVNVATKVDAATRYTTPDNAANPTLSKMFDERFGASCNNWTNFGVVGNRSSWGHFWRVDYTHPSLEVDRVIVRGFCSACRARAEVTVEEHRRWEVGIESHKQEKVSCQLCADKAKEPAP